MTPALYNRKLPQVTAVQWDGTAEAALWITANYAGSTRTGDDIVVRDSLDREQPLDPDTWVVVDEPTGMVTLFDPDAFAARYEPADV